MSEFESEIKDNSATASTSFCPSDPLLSSLHPRHRLQVRRVGSTRPPVVHSHHWLAGTFPMCRILLNLRNDTATVDATALPKNKSPPTPSTLMYNILNALVTLRAAVWYRGMVFSCKQIIGTEHLDFCFGLRLAKVLLKG